MCLWICICIVDMDCIISIDVVDGMEVWCVVCYYCV